MLGARKKLPGEVDFCILNNVIYANMKLYSQPYLLIYPLLISSENKSHIEHLSIEANTGGLSSLKALKWVNMTVFDTTMW